MIDCKYWHRERRSHDPQHSNSETFIERPRSSYQCLSEFESDIFFIFVRDLTRFAFSEGEALQESSDLDGHGGRDKSNELLVL